MSIKRTCEGGWGKQALWVCVRGDEMSIERRGMDVHETGKEGMAEVCDMGKRCLSSQSERESFELSKLRFFRISTPKHDLKGFDGDGNVDVEKQKEI